MQVMGESYSEDHDCDRLSSQCERLMRYADGQWRTLKEWAEITKGSEAGTSARLRQLANEFDYLKDRKRIDGGLWAYRLFPPPRHLVRYDENGQGVFI